MPGGAGGSILSMIISLKNNRALLRKRKNFRDIRADYIAELDKRKLTFKQADKKYLKELREELRIERKKEARALYAKVGIAGVLVFAIIFGTWILIPGPAPKRAENFVKVLSAKDSLRIKKSGYKYMISYGTYRYKVKDYNEAIHEYKGALELFPQDY